jgi:hypothetical protein
LITMALRTPLAGRTTPAQQEDREDGDGRSREAADLRPAAGPIYGGSLGQASGYAQAAKQARADIGAADGYQLLVCVQPIVTLCGVQPAGT